MDAGVAIGMDDRGRWIDNVFIERLWRSVKYEEAYLHAYSNGTEARTTLMRYFTPTPRTVLTRPSSTGYQTKCTSNLLRTRRRSQPEP